MYQVIQKRKIWLTVSGLMVGLSIAALAVWGLNFGIDFTGGSLIEVKFLNERLAASEARQALGDLDLGSLIVQPAGDDGMIFRFQDTAEEKHQQVLTALNRLSAIEELRYDSVGPSIGQELKTKSLYAAVIVIIAIILYIAWSFRKISKPVASWKYGLAADIALFHDVMIVLGVFAVLGEFAGVEVNTPFVAAILTILGYSVNDTIVVFDRIRENLPKSGEDFENTVNISINQTFSRSINTSLTVLLVLLSIFFFGGSTIRDFALALSIGVFVGTYSSIFLASPILVIWEKLRNRV